jgi:CubicO group peptidase (beta-lactamase class C family)
MAGEVFGPLGMTRTTFDFARALGANHASAHSLDIDGKPALAAMDVNYSIVPVRPAGGAWSSVTDVMKYVQMELARGVLPGGTRYVSEAVLKARQEPRCRSAGTSGTAWGCRWTRPTARPSCATAAA